MDDIQPGVHLVVTNAWIQKGDTYLIAQRSKSDPYKPGHRGLIGGKLDYVEGYDTLQNNLKKEIQEEVGIEVDTIQMLGNYMKTTKTTVLYITFHCTRKSGEPSPLEDTDAIQWMTKEELNLFTEPNIFTEFLPYII